MWRGVTGSSWSALHELSSVRGFPTCRHYPSNMYVSLSQSSGESVFTLLNVRSRRNRLARTYAWTVHKWWCVECRCIWCQFQTTEGAVWKLHRPNWVLVQRTVKNNFHFGDWTCLVPTWRFWHDAIACAVNNFHISVRELNFTVDKRHTGT